MDRTVQLFLSLVMDAIWLVFIALNALVVVAVVWAIYRMLHDHWTVRQLWLNARRRLLH